MSIFSGLKGFFAKLAADFERIFGKAPSFIHFTLALVTYAAPILEGILAVADPAVAALVTPIITRIQTGLATAYSLANEGTASGATLSTTLAAFVADLSTLESVAGIKDVATQAKVETILSEAQAIVALIPTPAQAVAGVAAAATTTLP
jgi:hypothetical protein